MSKSEWGAHHHDPLTSMREGDVCEIQAICTGLRDFAEARGFHRLAFLLAAAAEAAEAELAIMDTLAARPPHAPARRPSRNARREAQPPSL